MVGVGLDRLRRVPRGRERFTVAWTGVDLQEDFLHLDSDSCQLRATPASRFRRVELVKPLYAFSPSVLADHPVDGGRHNRDFFGWAGMAACARN